MMMNENDNDKTLREDLPQEIRFDYSKAKPNRFAERLADRQILVVRRTAMDLVLQKEAPPLRRDSSGALRIGDSRVLLELVIHAFEDGATPETIAQQYPTATRADLYSAVAYYLRHKDEVDAYLVGREQQAETVRIRIESQQGDLADVRSRLMAREKAMAS